MSAEIPNDGRPQPRLPRELPKADQPTELTVFGVKIAKQRGGGDFGWYSGRVAGCHITVVKFGGCWQARAVGWGVEKEILVEDPEVAERLLEHAIVAIRRELVQLIELPDPAAHDYVFDGRGENKIWKRSPPVQPEPLPEEEQTQP